MLLEKKKLVQVADEKQARHIASGHSQWTPCVVQTLAFILNTYSYSYVTA